ncbi:NAD-binding protein, partial [Acinetobacter baumannii]
GHAVRNEILEATNIGQARWLMIAIPDGLEAGQIALHARTLNPDLVIMARAHFDLEVEHLEAHDVDIVVMGEREIARTM